MKSITINVDDIVNKGRIVYPTKAKEKNPGIIALHGWGSKDHLKIGRQRAIIDLGFIYLTFDLRGHGQTSSLFSTSTREEHLRDSVAAYDFLVKQPGIDPTKIGIIGYSYGGYLAVLLTTLRPVSFLVLRSPALYRQENWEAPKALLRSLQDLPEYRKMKITSKENQLFVYTEQYTGYVLIIEAENDTVVPKEVIDNYYASFMNAKSLSLHVIPGANHELSKDEWQQEYIQILKGWLKAYLKSALKGEQ